MKKLKLPSIRRPRSGARSVRVSAARGRLDLVLPHGWPQSRNAVFWRWQSSGGTPQSGEVTDLKELPAAVRNAPAYVWTPAADTILTTATLPTRARSKILQALPYALEDRLLGDPETLHFAYRPETDGSLSVAVTAHERVRAWLDAFAQAGLHPVSLCPVTLLIPWALDCWSLLFIGNEILVRTGAVAGFACSLSIEQPPALLVSAVQEATRHAPQAPESLVVFNAPATFPAEAWTNMLALPLRIETGSIWDRQADLQAPLDLLQGRYRQTSEMTSAVRPFIPALVMLAIWLAGNAVVDITDWWQLHRQHTAYREEMTAILLDSFPETKTVLDPAVQMQRSVDALLTRGSGGEDELVSMLAKTAGALRATPRARMRKLQYAEHVLTLELSWPAPGSPDAFKSALETAGLRAEILSLTPRAGEVDGRVRLQMATPTPGKPRS